VWIGWKTFLSKHARWNVWILTVRNQWTNQDAGIRKRLPATLRGHHLYYLTYNYDYEVLFCMLHCSVLCSSVGRFSWSYSNSAVWQTNHEVSRYGITVKFLEQLLGSPLFLYFHRNPFLVPLCFISAVRSTLWNKRTGQRHRTIAILKVL
jgi:hypothetical protein